MKKPPSSRELHQHASDKSVIDHMISGPSRPDMTSPGQKDRREFTEDSGRRLEKALHKEWTADKGGLPDF